MYQIFIVSCGIFLAMHEFSSCSTQSSVGVACGPSHLAVYGIQVPQPGIKLTSKVLQDGSLTTGPKGSPCPFYRWGNYLSLRETEEWSILSKVNFVVQSLSHVQIFMTPWTTAHQAPLFSTVSQSLFKFMSTESVMPSNNLILCHPSSSCLQSFPASGSLSKTWLFASGGQSIGASD